MSRNTIVPPSERALKLFWDRVERRRRRRVYDVEQTKQKTISSQEDCSTLDATFTYNPPVGKQLDFQKKKGVVDTSSK